MSMSMTTAPATESALRAELARLPAAIAAATGRGDLAVLRDLRRRQAEIPDELRVVEVDALRRQVREVRAEHAALQPEIAAAEAGYHAAEAAVDVARRALAVVERERDLAFGRWRDARDNSGSVDARARDLDGRLRRLLAGPPQTAA